MNRHRCSVGCVGLLMIAIMIFVGSEAVHGAEIFTRARVETADGGTVQSDTGLSEVIGLRSSARADADVSGNLGNIRIQISTDRAAVPPTTGPDGGAVLASATFVGGWTSGAAVGSGGGASLGVIPVLNVHGLVGPLPNGEITIEYSVVGQLFDTSFNPPQAFSTFSLLDVRLTVREGSVDAHGEICTDSGCTPVTIPGPSLSASIALPMVSIGGALAAGAALGFPVSGGMFEVATIKGEMDPDRGDSGFADFFNTVSFGLQAGAPGLESVWVSDSGRALIPAQSTDDTPPTTVATLSPAPNAAGWNNQHVVIRLTAQDEADGSGVKEIHVDINGGETIVTAGGDNTSAVITAEGTTTVTYFAVDNAGNQEAAQTVTIRIDKTAPTVACVPVPRRKHHDHDDKRGLFRVTASDTLSGLAGITLGGVALAQGETIQIHSKKKAGVRLVGNDDDEDDRDEGGVKRFKVGPGESVIRATDVAGNLGSAACPVGVK